MKRKKNDEWMEKNKTKAMESDSQLIGWSLKRALKTHPGGKELSHGILINDIDMKTLTSIYR